jgi:DNA-directed RNA polymerase subunit RPC12/RpoP
VNNNWNQISDQALLYWQEFMTWFLNMPIPAQVLIIIGAVASLILSVLIVYFVLKGVGYLIYYILKGVYLLLKGIFEGLYKLFEEIYYDISGKPKPVKKASSSEEQKINPPQTYVEPEIIKPVLKEIQTVQPNAVYCSECGSQYTERMLEQLAENGVAFCVYCGKGYKANLVEA